MACSVVEFRDGYGRSHWQPQREDGSRLYVVVYSGWGSTLWDDPSTAESSYWTRIPKTYRWKWYAKRRARRATAALRRATLREIRPVNENSGAAVDGPAEHPTPDH